MQIYYHAVCFDNSYNSLELYEFHSVDLVHIRKMNSSLNGVKEGMRDKDGFKIAENCPLDPVGI